MSTRATLMSVSAALVMGLAWWAWLSADDAGAETADSVSSSGSPGRQEPGGGRSNAPHALSGVATVSDATGLTLDAARLFELGFGGGLVLERDTRASIEALVNSMPPDPSPQDMERLQQTLRAGLPYAEAEKAYKLITGYRSYSRGVQREMLPMGIPKNQQEAAALYDRMDAVKRRYFDAGTAHALFGNDERFARLAMEVGFIQQDASLSDEQKVQAVEGVRARLPADRRDLIPPFEPQRADPPAPGGSQPAS